MTSTANTPLSSDTDRAEVAQTIRGLVAQELKLATSAVPDDTPLKELDGADSIHLLRVVAQIERTYEVEFEDEDVFAVATLEDFVNLVLRQKPTAGAGQ